MKSVIDEIETNVRFRVGHRVEKLAIQSVVDAAQASMWVSVFEQIGVSVRNKIENINPHIELSPIAHTMNLYVGR